MTQTSYPTTAIIGTGSMGTNFLKGLILVEAEVYASARSSASAAKVSETLEHPVESLETNPQANQQIAAQASVVILAVPPVELPAVMNDIAPVLTEGTLLISLAAGVSLQRLRTQAPAGVEVVRAMPNLGSAYWLGVTGLGLSDELSEKAREQAVAVLSSAGEVVEVRDDQLDAVSAISGTGPGYFYFFTQQLADAARQLGFTDEQARKLTEGTFIGAAAALKNAGEPIEELNKAFTHPDSTSVHAIRVLEEQPFGDFLTRAAHASMARAQELAAEADKAFED